MKSLRDAKSMPRFLNFKKIRAAPGAVPSIKKAEIKAVLRYLLLCFFKIKNELINSKENTVAEAKKSPLNLP